MRFAVRCFRPPTKVNNNGAAGDNTSAPLEGLKQTALIKKAMYQCLADDGQRPSKERKANHTLTDSLVKLLFHLAL